MIKLQANGINGILADEMGLGMTFFLYVWAFDIPKVLFKLQLQFINGFTSGKTLQSISIVAYMREFRNINGPHLVMVPKSTLPNWCKEFEHWCPVIRILRFHGNKDERADIVQNHLKPGMIV